MSDFEKKIGYKFKNKRLLREALTHSSYDKKHCNERLEFLGDSVLSVITAKHLFEKLPSEPEGKLTKLRSGLVCESSLFEFADRIGLGNALILGKGEEQTGGRMRRSVVSDAFEALIAAIFLDGGLVPASEFVLKFLPTANALKKDKLCDYKTELQEIVQRNPDSKIAYEITDETGEAHLKIFTANVCINEKIFGIGTGASKKEAEQNAAKKAIKAVKP